MLQPFDFDAAPDKNKHKFMIQTLVEPEEIDTPENMVINTLFCITNYFLLFNHFNNMFYLLKTVEDIF